MTRATLQDKAAIIALLAAAFHDNKSVNYIIRQDQRRRQRIEALMAYSFTVCLRYGAVFWSAQKDACALLLFPDQKKPGLQSVWLDLQLAARALGYANLLKVMRREGFVKSRHPNNPFAYLWFIGVAPGYQGKGAGTRLMLEVSAWCKQQGRTVYLETSHPRNLAFYEKTGYRVFEESMRFGYPLYFLRQEI